MFRGSIRVSCDRYGRETVTTVQQHKTKVVTEIHKDQCRFFNMATGKWEDKLVVVTDDNGVNTFDLVYLKNQAYWIDIEVTATTLVLGSETRTTYPHTLIQTQSDVDSQFVFDSPYGDNPTCATCF